MSPAFNRLLPFSIVFPFCHSNQQYGKPNTLFIPVCFSHLFLPIKKAV